MAIRIPLELVDSSNLAARGYDLERSILAVQFKTSGIIFHYAGVPADLARTFFEADSSGKFSGERMTGPCGKCGSEGWIGELCGDCGTALHVGVSRRAEP